MNLRWRSFLVRRVLARFHIGEDILRHLSTFQRLGERLEATPPGEMVPVGLRTVLRAIRTRGAAQIRPDWIWPYWLELQLDPRQEAFIPRGHLPFLTNVTARNWTQVGPLDSEWEAIVDPRGMVTPWFDGWSLDWWVGAADGWHFPSRSDHVRQDLLGSTPVVVTTMPLPEGDVSSSAYSPVDQDVAVMEIRNGTPRPLDVAFALRPYNPEGLAVVERMQVEGSLVTLDGRPALRLPESPDRGCWSTFRGGDCARKLIREGPASLPSGAVKDPAGMLQACFVYQIPAGGETRALMPLPHEHRRKIRPPAPAQIPASSAIESAERVAGAWQERLAGGMQVKIPDQRLQNAIQANRAFMLLFLDGADITPGPYTYHRFWFRDAAYQLVALDRWGFHDEAERVLASFRRRQHADGFFYSQWREWDSNGAALWALAEHHRLTARDAIALGNAGSVSRGASWIMRKCKQRPGEKTEVQGLFPPGISAEHLGPYDHYYWDNFWGWRGLLDAVYLLDKAGRPEEALRARNAASRLESAILRSLGIVAKKLGATAIPAGPTRGIDAGMIGSLAACYPLKLLSPADPLIQRTSDLIRERFCIGNAFFQSISHTGLGTYLTLQLAFVELEAGDPRCLERLAWMLDAATTTHTWPEAIHPRLGGGCIGDGHHGWAAADFLSFVRNLLVRETADGLALLSFWPAQWAENSVEVTDAPTHYGPISFGVDWEGGRATLWWRAEHDGVRLSCPGLDPSWTETAPEGRATFTVRRGSEAAFGTR